MTVKELIIKLSEYPENLRVTVSGYEGGVDDITSFEREKIYLNVNEEDYYGAHDAFPFPPELKGDKEPVDSLHLR